MTDAREIIARAVAVARGDTPEGKYWAQLSPKSRDDAELGVRRLFAAGFRIVGPGEDKALTFELAQLRHAYTHLIAGRVIDQKQFAEGLVAPAIRALESALAEEKRP